MHQSILTITKYSQKHPTKKQTHNGYVLNRNTIQKKNLPLLHLQNNQMPNDVILIVSTSSHLGLGCDVPSSRSREEAFASFCSPLVLEVVGLVLLKKYIRYKPKYEQEKHNEDFGNSPNHNPAMELRDSFCFLALCSLSFLSPHPFCPLRLLCTSTLRTFPWQAFALPKN